jgi:hypothetical protein
MAFRKDVLERLGGFDPQFRVAGDDVDICWRLRTRGWTIGYSAAAMVWHRRRSSIGAYLRQQKGYGAAEGLLERKWPERYNFGGHPRWSGRMYGDGAAAVRLSRRWRIYYGTWGSGLFQSVYRPAPSLLGSFPLMPEWYLLLAALAVLTVFGVVRPSFGLHLPGTPISVFALLLALAFVATLARGLASAWHAFPQFAGRPSKLLRLRLLTAALHVLQPLARLIGRMRHGLTPWRRRPSFGYVLPRPRATTTWREEWQQPDEALREIESELRNAGAMVARGSAFERWDLEVRIGNFGAARVRMAVEEHGRGRQFFRFRVWPCWSRFGVQAAVLLAAAAAYVGAMEDVAASILFAAPAAWVVTRIVSESAAAQAIALGTLAARQEEQQERAPDLAATLVAMTGHMERRALDSKPIAEAAD